MDVTCDFCNAPIPTVAFDRGEAVRLLKKVYCPACRQRAILESKQADKAPSRDFLTPRPKVRRRNSAGS